MKSSFPRAAPPATMITNQRTEPGAKDNREPSEPLLLGEVLQPSPFSGMEAKEEKRDVGGEKAQLQICDAGSDGLEQPDGKRPQSRCHNDEDHRHDPWRLTRRSLRAVGQLSTRHRED